MMKITTDSFYTIGSDHKVCQDYAYSGQSYGIHYAVISDGCSSAPSHLPKNTPSDTDIGSRLLCHAFKNFITRITHNRDYTVYYENNPHHMYTELYLHIRESLNNAIKFLGLKPYCCFATIRGVIVMNTKVFMFNFGDGHTALHFPENDDITLFNSPVFPDNTPYYFLNHMNEWDKDAYLTKFEDDVVIDRADGNSESVDEYINDHNNFYFCAELPDKDCTYFVLSDGFDSFYIDNGKRARTFLDYREKLTETLIFPNKNGIFIQRRFGKYLRDLKKDGINHYDDLSVAAIHIKRDNE